MKSKITMHGKVRIKQRMYFPNKSYSEVLNRVKKYGKRLERYEGNFFQFLTLKRLQYRCRIVICDEMVFAFAKDDNKLITVYKVPEKYLPTSDYEIDEKIYKKIAYLRSLSRCAIRLILNDGTTYEGCVARMKNTTPWVDIKLELFDGRVIKVMGEDIKSIEPIALKIDKTNKKVEITKV